MFGMRPDGHANDPSTNWENVDVDGDPWNTKIRISSDKQPSRVTLPDSFYENRKNKLRIMI